MKEGSTWTTLNTLAAWEQNPSKKVDIVVEGIKYHLLSDHQQPLKIENNRVGLPTPTSSIELEAQDLQVPDKIVIFSNFRSTLDLIKNVSRRDWVSLNSNVSSIQVLELHGISSLLLHGGLDPDERKEVVNKFQLTDRDGERVLLMSQVASVGINLPCANILFIFVRSHLIFFVWPMD
jgi:SNF2 family DNA or RNA helicase